MKAFRQIAARSSTAAHKRCFLFPVSGTCAVLLSQRVIRNKVIDYKVSMGQDITIIEVRLTSNNQYLHRYGTQIEEYEKAEHTNNMIYVLVDLGNPGKVKKVQNLFMTENMTEGQIPLLLL